MSPASLVRSAVVLPALVAALTACKPTNATVTEGAFAAFLADSTSVTVTNEQMPLDGTAIAYDFDCREEPSLDGLASVCESDAFPPVHEGWAGRDGYHVMAEDLVVWRGEAILTSEHDLQLTFHHHLPGGDDFRFLVVLDPNFQPKVCAQSADGGIALEDIDGDWVGNWSKDLGVDDGSKLFYLNSSSYQFNPNKTSETWVLPQEWRAGYARGKYGPEDLVLRSARYGLPSVYANFENEEGSDPRQTDLFYVAMEEGSDPTQIQAFQAQVDRVEGIVAESQAEFAAMSGGQLETLMGGAFGFEPRAHSNSWRIPDASASGLDGWAEIHYNWISFDSGSGFEVGDTMSGDFHLLLEATESASVVLVRGHFEVDGIKRDRWTTPNVDEIKMEENNTTFCGQ